MVAAHQPGVAPALLLVPMALRHHWVQIRSTEAPEDHDTDPMASIPAAE